MLQHWLGRIPRSSSPLCVGGGGGCNGDCTWESDDCEDHDDDADTDAAADDAAGDADDDADADNADDDAGKNRSYFWKGRYHHHLPAPRKPGEA